MDVEGMTSWDREIWYNKGREFSLRKEHAEVR